MADLEKVYNDSRLKGYFVCSCGKVVNTNLRGIPLKSREVGYKIVKGHINKYGYLEYIFKDKKDKGQRIVARAFIENINNLEEVNHKDENKLNNCYLNLEWCSRAYNNRYSKKGRKSVLRIAIPIIQLDFEGNIIMEYESINKVKQFGYSKIMVHKAVSGKQNTHAGFIWVKKEEFDNFKLENYLTKQVKNYYKK